MVARTATNLAFWMEHELRSYPRSSPGLPALRANAGRLVLAVGQDSGARNLPPYRPNTILAERLALNLVEFPGDHLGYATRADGFADRLRRVRTQDPVPDPEVSG